MKEGDEVSYKGVEDIGVINEVAGIVAEVEFPKPVSIDGQNPEKAWWLALTLLTLVTEGPEPEASAVPPAEEAPVEVAPESGRDEPGDPRADHLQHAARFLHWLKTDKRLHLCEYLEQNVARKGYYPIDQNVEQLMAEYGGTVA